MIAALLDLIPDVGATIAGVLIGLVALSVSLGALIAVYQLIENYLLQPTIIGRRPGLGLHRARQRPCVRALFGLIGAIVGVPIAAALQDRRQGAHRRQESSRRRG